MSALVRPCSRLFVLATALSGCCKYLSGYHESPGSDFRARGGPRGQDRMGEREAQSARETSILDWVPDPSRPRLKALPSFAGTATSRSDPGIQTRVETFVVAECTRGRSLIEIAELTDRPHSAIRNI